MKRVAEKIKSRVNIIWKLAGTSWGSNACTLWTASPALVYSTAEYFSPVWAEGHHTKCLDTILNSSMRIIISGTLKSTPLQWLPVLSNITLPGARGKARSLREFDHIEANPDLPIYEDQENLP